MSAKETSPLIYKKMAQVVADIGAIGKSGKNTFDNYAYRKIDDFYNAVGPALSKNGIVCVPNVLDAIEQEGASEKGKKQIRTRLKVQYRFFAEDGSFVDSIVWGEAIDRSDKSYNKALTAAYKYMLIQAFCIPVQDIEDADSESPELGATTTRQIQSAESVAIERLVRAFSSLGVTKDDICGRYDLNNIKSLTNEMIDELREVHKEIKTGKADIKGYF